MEWHFANSEQPLAVAIEKRHAAQMRRALRRGHPAWHALQRDLAAWEVRRKQRLLGLGG